jgi:mannitol/fructose-specific phosphotransferase system IIA component (Ntr-type)
MKLPSSSPLVLSELLAQNGMALNLAGRQREAVLAELIDCVRPLADRPAEKQTLLRALLEREQLCSTGIGDGVALPHCRNALVGLVERPVMVFGRHPQGIPYGSIDNTPARLFFLIVAPNVSQHLQLLARISRLVRDPKLRQNLLLADRLEKVIALVKETESRS